MIYVYVILHLWMTFTLRYMVSKSFLASGSAAFKWKLHCHWLKCFCHDYFSLVRQGSGGLMMPVGADWVFHCHGYIAVFSHASWPHLVDDIFRCISFKEIFAFGIYFSWNVPIIVLLTISHLWFKKWFGPSPEAMMTQFITHVYH